MVIGGGCEWLYILCMWYVCVHISKTYKYNRDIIPEMVGDPTVYVTTIGLYNGSRELIAVAKLNEAAGDMPKGVADSVITLISKAREIGLLENLPFNQREMELLLRQWHGLDMSIH